MDGLYWRVSSFASSSCDGLQIVDEQCYLAIDRHGQLHILLVSVLSDSSRQLL